MGKKKGKKEKGKGAEKAAAKLAKKAMKEESMEELEAMIAQFRDIDKSITEVNVKESKHPSPRINLSMVLHPEKDEIILFGGEYYNGKKAVTVQKEGGQMWVFGGEFASPNHAKFYHYNDLWVLHLKDKRWEQIKATGGPSARSGHRMILYKRQLIIFGGFHESSKDFMYFNDCYSFSLLDYTWTKLAPTGNGPCPRSGCQLSLSPNGILVIGGYSKTKIKKDIDKGNIHSDIYLLSPESQDQQICNKWKWQRIKDSGSKPSSRSGFGATSIGGNRVAIFGGVTDEEEEEELDSVFYNTMYCLDVVSYRWFPLELRKSKQPKKKKEKQIEDKADAEESMEQDKEEIQETPDSPDKESPSEDIWIPCPRMNPLMVMKHNTLYLYGGIYEEDEKQITLNDMWTIDLKRMNTWKQVVEADDNSGDWSEEESSDSGSDENVEQGECSKQQDY